MKKSLVISLMILFSVTGILSPGFSADNSQKSSFRNDIIELFEMMGSYKLSLQLLDQVMDSMKKGFNERLPKEKRIPDEVWANMVEEFKSELDKESYYGMMAPIYEKYFTAADIKDILAFYKSPAGRKFIETMPNVMKESVETGQEWARKIIQKITPRIQERLKDLTVPKTDAG